MEALNSHVACWCHGRILSSIVCHLPILSKSDNLASMVYAPAPLTKFGWWCSTIFLLSSCQSWISCYSPSSLVALHFCQSNLQAIIIERVEVDCYPIKRCCFDLSNTPDTDIPSCRAILWFSRFSPNVIALVKYVRFYRITIESILVEWWLKSCWWVTFGDLVIILAVVWKCSLLYNMIRYIWFMIIFCSLSHDL
jgi:hypothetical protein